MTSLIGKVLKNKSLPRNSEILKSTGNALKDFATNPVSFVRRGLRRDRIANQLYKNVTGQSRLQKKTPTFGGVHCIHTNQVGKDIHRIPVNKMAADHSWEGLLNASSMHIYCNF